MTNPRGESGPIAAAERLKEALADQMIVADIHKGFGLALVSVWADLVVWCDGMTYRWWTGRLSARTGRRVYTICPAHAPITAARRVAQRRREITSA